MELAVHHGWFNLDSVFKVVSDYAVMLVYVVAYFLPLRSIFSVPSLRLVFIFGKDGFTLLRSILTVLNTRAISIVVYLGGF